MAKAFSQSKPEFVEVRLNARLTPEKLQAMLDAKFPIYVARIIHDGVCGYGDDITYVSKDVLYSMQQSFVGRPVVLHHDLDITDENMEEKAKGFVTECWTEDGSTWWVKFVIKDMKLAEKIDNDGFNFVSCAYIITAFGEPAVHDGIECTTVVDQAFYHHLAITDSPRYDNTEVFRINENDAQGLYKIVFSDIVKINENDDSKVQVSAWKPVEVADDELFETDAGTLSQSEMVSKINELSAQLSQKDTMLATKESECVQLREKLGE